MQLFLSYASEDRQIAEQIQLALIGAGHHVFFDRESLPAGGDYHARIHNAVQESDLLVFLISPESVLKGSYALTELKHARKKWPHPKNKVVPVILRPTSWDSIPNYLKSVTVLEPDGNVAAEVVTEVATLEKQHAPTPQSVQPIPTKSNNQPSHEHSRGQRLQVLIAIIGLIGVLGAAVISNWSSLFGSALEKEGAPPPAPASEKISGKMGGHVIVFDGFKHFDRSGFKFATKSLVPWNAGDADLLVATPEGAHQPHFFLPYESETYKHPEWDRGAQAGIQKIPAARLSEVKECPTDSYEYHWYPKPTERGQIQRGEIYCVRSRSGTHYAVVKVVSIDTDRIGFDYVFQPAGSARF